MRKILAITIFISCMANAQTRSRLNVLFLGNSYTYVNDLPLMIKNIAAANNDTLFYDSNCPGGHTFQNHWNNSTSIAKINAQPWNCVVLQAQSQEPSFSPAQVAAQTLPYAVKLDSLIKLNNSCTETVFYETWGRKNGDASNCPFYTPVCTYLGMQDRLKQSYKLFSDTAHGIMSPVGEAFRRSIALDPSLELYQTDQSHPSLAGTYLAACVFYEVLFHRSVVANTYDPGLSPVTRTFLQDAAHVVVADSLELWNLGINTPWAPFSFTSSGAGTYQFTSASPAMQNQWSFSDGTNSIQANPNHTFVSSAPYYATHIVSNACGVDSIKYELSSSAIALSANENVSAIEIMPNPASDKLTLKTGSLDGIISITDMGGKQLYKASVKKNEILEIKLADFVQGIYHICFVSENGLATKKLVKL